MVGEATTKTTGITMNFGEVAEIPEAKIKLVSGVKGQTTQVTTVATRKTMIQILPTTVGEEAREEEMEIHQTTASTAANLGTGRRTAFKILQVLSTEGGGVIQTKLVKSVDSQVTWPRIAEPTMNREEGMARNDRTFHKIHGSKIFSVSQSKAVRVHRFKKTLLTHYHNNILSLKSSLLIQILPLR
jgi:hypothetical protein